MQPHGHNIISLEKGLLWPPRNVRFAFLKAEVLKLFLESISNDKKILSPTKLICLYQPLHEKYNQSGRGSWYNFYGISQGTSKVKA